MFFILAGVWWCKIFSKMDLKDCIKKCTKIDETQRVSNIKWSPVPRNPNRTPRHSNQSLPYFLEMEQRLHEPSERKEAEDKNDKEDEEFQFFEIREKLRECGVGWDAQKGVKKRYRDSQMKYAKVVLETSSSESSTSFTTAHTTTTSLTDDSFSSALQDFEYLHISDDKKEENTKSIIQLREKNCVVTENVSACLTNENLTEKENFTKEKRKIGRYENKTRKFKGKKNAAKSRQPLKDLVPKNAKKKDNLVQKKVCDVNRNYYMNLSDERLSEFVSKKTKNSKKVLTCMSTELC